MAPTATRVLPPADRTGPAASRSPRLSTEEVCFTAALICLEGHYSDRPPMAGPKTRTKVSDMLTKTLEKTHTKKEVREALSTNVEIWIYMAKIFVTAVPALTERSIVPLCHLTGQDKSIGPQDDTAYVLKNHVVLKQELPLLIKLMHIARNLVVTTTAQDICAAVSFDQAVYQTIILCISVTSKGFEGEMTDEATRTKLHDVNELCTRPPPPLSGVFASGAVLADTHDPRR